MADNTRVADENRRASRIDEVESVDIKAGANSGEGTIIDLSAGGMFACTDVDLSVGEACHLEFSLNDEPYAIDAKVARMEEGRGIAFEFRNVLPHVRLALVTHVARNVAAREVSHFIDPQSQANFRISSSNISDDTRKDFQEGRYQKGYLKAANETVAREKEQEAGATKEKVVEEEEVLTP